jgi:PhnB protein
MAAKPIPEGFHSLTPFLVIAEPEKTFDFYEKGLGATRKYVKKTPDGKVMHAEFVIGDCSVMFSEEMPETGCIAPKESKQRTSAVWFYVDNVDEVYSRAIAAGGKSEQEPMDAFWGDRLATVIDPSGHVWHIATHKEDVSDQEIDKRAEQFFAQAQSMPPAQSSVQ